ncbi:MAG TPA: hypothetical protein VF777_07365 [Phycisphaerales bacterium]
MAIGYLPTPALVGHWLGARSVSRHPCEDHLCGCANPLECWTACCCLTRSERIAWAIATGVEPPREVRVTDDEIGRVAKSMAAAGGRRGVVSVAVLRHRMARGEATESSGEAKPRGRTMSALGCKFVPQILALAAPVSVNASRVVGGIMILPQAGLVETVNERSGTRSLDVDAPPPRA